MSLYIVGHQYPTSNIFLDIISITKCPHEGPSCNSFITIYVSVVVKHCRNLLFWPILYNSPFFNVKGYALLTNLCFCLLITCFQSILTSNLFLHHLAIQVLFKANLHLWFDQTHMWVL